MGTYREPVHEAELVNIAKALGDTRQQLEGMSTEPLSLEAEEHFLIATAHVEQARAHMSLALITQRKAKSNDE